MKYITAVAIVVTAVLGCSYVGESKAETCADVWASNPQTKTATFIDGATRFPNLAEDVKRESINTCNSAADFSQKGGSMETTIRLVNEGTRGKNIPEEGRLSMVYMAVGGWKIGAEKR